MDNTNNQSAPIAIHDAEFVMTEADFEYVAERLEHTNDVLEGVLVSMESTTSRLDALLARLERVEAAVGVKPSDPKRQAMWALGGLVLLALALLPVGAFWPFLALASLAFYITSAF